MRKDIKEARKQLKRILRELELEWWGEVIEVCQTARGRIGQWINVGGTWVHEKGWKRVV